MVKIKKKSILVIVINFLLVFYSSQGITTPLAHEVNISKQDFENFLSKNKHYKRYSFFLSERKRILSHRLSESLTKPAHQSLFDPENAISSCNSILNFLNENKLSITELEYLTDTVEKVKEAQLRMTFQNQSQRAAHQKNSNCWSEIKNYINPLVISSKEASLPGDSVKNTLFPNYSVLLLNGSPMDINKIKREIFGSYKYQWEWYSDSYIPIIFHGSFDELKTAHFELIPLIQGSCDNFLFRGDDFEMRTNGAVYFTTTCVPRIESRESIEDSFLHRPSKWLIPAGLAIGAMIYFLKENQIVLGGNTGRSE